MAKVTKWLDVLGVLTDRLANEILARVNASPNLQLKFRMWNPRGKFAKRICRSPEALQELAEELIACVMANPGSRISEISRALGYPHQSIVPTMRKLVAAKKLTTTGVRSSVRYFAKPSR